MVKTLDEIGYSCRRPLLHHHDETFRNHAVQQSRRFHQPAHPVIGRAGCRHPDIGGRTARPTTRSVVKAVNNCLHDLHLQVLTMVSIVLTLFSSDSGSTIRRLVMRARRTGRTTELQHYRTSPRVPEAGPRRPDPQCLAEFLGCIGTRMHWKRITAAEIPWSAAGRVPRRPQDVRRPLGNCDC